MEAVTGSNSIREHTLIQMVNEYQSALLNLCYMYLHDAALAEDAVQETFLKAYKGLDRFRGDCGQKTWLTHIAVNVCRDIQRSTWFRHEDRRISPEMQPYVPTHNAEESAELAMAIVKLPSKYKEVILLYFYQDMGVREIGKALGIAPSTVSNRLKRAEKKLRTILEGSEFE